MTEIVSLDGVWRLGWFDGYHGDHGSKERGPEAHARWVEAVVPGEVHQTLVAAGILAPIEKGAGALAARWVEEVQWYFVREFEIDGEFLERHGELVFDRLELDAQVYLNGERVGVHRTAFRPLRIDVTGKLKTANTLRIELDSGLFGVADLPSREYRHSLNQALHKRHWLRTIQSQFQWDNTPRLVNVGITESVRLEFRALPIRLAAVVPLVTLSEDHTVGRINCRLMIEAGEAATVNARIAVPELQLVAEAKLQVPPGESRHEIELIANDPELWWPRGLGTQKLYRLTVDLTAGNGAVASEERDIGFRTIVVDQSPVEDGRLFKLVVNGTPVFARGSNWVPISLTPHPVDRVLVELHLDRAEEANFNFIRVWGGGDYESDAFYEGCDRRGILVWQEFIFACSRYPTNDPAFRAEIVQEARYQMRRLASHACLALWCGNNEIAWIGDRGRLIWGEDPPTPAEVREDHRYFEKDLPILASEEDPTRYYHPTSPWSPADSDVNARLEGDQHPWHVGFSNVNFLDYREMDARFPNEGGLLGPPSLASVLDALPEGQRYYDSFCWKLHDNRFAIEFPDRPLDRLLKEWTGKHPNDLTMEEFTYWAGLMQGEALTEYTNNYRWRSATNGASVFWMFNDVWPTVRSWGIVDYRSRRNPSFHAVRRAFEPVRPIVVADPGGATVYVVNDGPSAVQVELEWGTVAIRGGSPTNRRTLTIAPGPATVVERIDAHGGDPAYAAVAILRGAGGELIASSRLLAGPFVSIPWPEARISITRNADSITLISPDYVLGVCLDLVGDRYLTDNFFDLFPNTPHTVGFEGAEAPTVLHVGNSMNSTR